MICNYLSHWKERSFIVSVPIAVHVLPPTCCFQAVIIAGQVLHFVTLGVTIVTEMDTVQRIDNLSATLFGKARRGILSLLYGRANEEY